MSLIDAAIPGLFGLLLLLWPRLVFVGSKVTPDEGRIRLIRRLGGLLLLIAGAFATIHFLGR
jgi:hypothetical protein